MDFRIQLPLLVSHDLFKIHPWQKMVTLIHGDHLKVVYFKVILRILVGQLGHGTTSAQLAPTAIEKLKGINVRQISSGNSHTAAISGLAI